MVDLDFKSFSKIAKIDALPMVITQKIHGSNAQVVIFENGHGELDILVGSRTRYLSPEADNYGFCSFINDNKQEFIEKLGIGRYFGEWAGPGINSGEGLTEKTFILFDHYRFPPERPLPPQTRVVPVLYTGKLDSDEITIALEDLSFKGSKLVPGFMRPEGIVVEIGGVRYKKVFNPEETAWTKPGHKTAKEKIASLSCSVEHLLQAIRLEKLLSRDSQYLENYPISLPEIVKEYVADLEAEGQFNEVEDIKQMEKKSLGKVVYLFIRNFIENERGII